MTLDLVVPEEPAAHTTHAQWRVETMQLVNWGGFHGRHQVRFSQGSTLLSGASGTGKSTLLDAYLALMMTSDTPFNGASNEAGGRARSAEQRNLLTYLRGKMDTSRVSGSDELRDQVLRGRDGEPLWGALAGTFINDDGRRYTVIRIFFARAGATLSGDVVTTFAAFEGYLDLTRLEPLAAQRFDKRALKAAVAGLATFNTFWEFEENLHTRLGIGGGDGGRLAMRLLARVQAGMKVTRVDDTYKRMVLEKPITFKAADDALEHFADLEASYSKMVDEASKLKALQRLPALQQDLAEAEAKELLIRQFGADEDGSTPFRLWLLRTERALLDTAVVENRRDHAETSVKHAQAKADEARHEGRLTQIADEKRKNGGDAIDERQRQIADETGKREQVYQASIKFQTRTEVIDLVVPETAEQFAEAQAAAAEFLAGVEGRAAALQNEEESLRDELSPLTAREVDLLDEQKSLTGRAGMVPRRMHEARVRMAQAAGLDPMNDLPFVAELIDVMPDQERWRKAVETTLGGLASMVLVSRDIRDRFSSAIDGVLIRPRIRYRGVTLAEHEEWRGDPAYVSGKLVFKDSPFSRWVQDRVAADGIDHFCVEDAESLGGYGPRVALSGQTRNGDQGAHGESDNGNIIGFSNERRLADIDALLAELEPRIKDVRKRISTVRERLGDLRLQKEAHAYVQDANWAGIDYLGVERRIDELRDEISRLRAANEILDALQNEEERLKPLLKEANRQRVITGEALGKLDKRHVELVDDQDTAQNAIDAIDNAQTAVVTDAQQAYLDLTFASNWDAENLEQFSSNMAKLRRRLRDEVDAARKAAKSATSAMEAMFEAYQRQWKEHSLDTSIHSADGYREILDRIEAEGLHGRRDRWRREFAAWSSDDLLRLSDAFDIARDDITNRLVPINRILEGLPFGGKGILQINSRPLQSDDLKQFRRALRELASGIALEQTEQQIETRFKRLQEFMNMLRVPEGHSKSSTSVRDRYLDVRQHVVITAVCLDESRREIATYDALGGKSGGETQELVAFIVGAALRYQLGDEDRSRPRFAPVFLDEAFVKSDSEFAGRAVRAWQDLGFQLVIGAPLDKVTALEPHMDLLLTVTKNYRGYSYVSDLPDAPELGGVE